jgi:hypothetical protein
MRNLNPSISSKYTKITQLIKNAHTIICGNKSHSSMLLLDCFPDLMGNSYIISFHSKLPKHITSSEINEKDLFDYSQNLREFSI